ncbi:MAG: ACT domain-containing protein [Clostridiaceae bacterium]|nr:ACT domain-containing protein [Clostridiaceae bacterium]
MLIKQISVFVENKYGKLVQITDILAQNNINILAISIADTTDFGILRLIVNDPQKAEKVLRDAQVTVKCTDVICISVPDVPGALHKALKVITEAGISIEYVYGFFGKAKKRDHIVLRVDQPDKAIAELKANDIEVLTCEDVYC